MKKILRILCVSMCVFIFLPMANATTLTFEELIHEDTSIVDHGAVYTENGFVITNIATEADSGFLPSLASVGTLAYEFSGSTALFNDNYGGTTVMTREGGGLFTLSSITLSELYPFDYDPEFNSEFDIEFSGFFSDGSAISQTFTLDGLVGVETFSFDTGFTDLVSARWLQTPDIYQFDDIKANPVPEPSSILLFGLGLVYFAGVRRNKIN